MAKRFTDTEKWKRPWFNELPVKAKLVWFYLLDNCDHAGIWPADFGLLSYQMGFSVKPFELKNWFEDKITQFADDKYYIPSFVEFQYGNLNPNNRVHKSILERVEKEGASKPLVSPIIGAMEKDKEMEMEMDKEMDKEMEEEMEEEKEEEKEKQNFDSSFEILYQRYPRKIGKAEGIKRCKRDVKNQADFDALELAISHFVAYHRGKQTEEQYIPHFSTFMSSWRDWCDPETGKGESFSGSSGIDWSKVFKPKEGAA